MNIMRKSLLIVFAAALTILAACKDEENTTTPTNNNTGTDELAIYKKIYGASDIYKDGDYVVIKTNGRPDHKSPYYQSTQWEATLYEAYNGSNPQYNTNPNRIATVNYTFRIPLNPTKATTAQQTPMGPMGVSLNGVPLFNQYAAGRTALTGEINSFDQYGGHPAQAGDYHYHLEPTFLTTNKGKDALLGFLLDGYPVYGPMENNKTITNADLDAYHGHSHATADYPNGIYHYHITAQDPYINGDGFYGVPGTVTK
ncbi:MAG: YHYH protein [Bacteroidota bacterium]